MSFLVPNVTKVSSAATDARPVLRPMTPMDPPVRSSLHKTPAIQVDPDAPDDFTDGSDDELVYGSSSLTASAAPPATAARVSTDRTVYVSPARRAVSHRPRGVAAKSSPVAAPRTPSSLLSSPLSSPLAGTSTSATAASRQKSPAPVRSPELLSQSTASGESGVVPLSKRVAVFVAARARLGLGATAAGKASEAKKVRGVASDMLHVCILPSLLVFAAGW